MLSNYQKDEITQYCINYAQIPCCFSIFIAGFIATLIYSFTKDFYAVFIAMFIQSTITAIGLWYLIKKEIYKLFFHIACHDKIHWENDID